MIKRTGHFWVRKTKNGKLVMVGYVYLPYCKGQKRKIHTVRISLNYNKTNEKAPDYIMTDYTEDIKNHGRKISVHDTYQTHVEKRGSQIPPNGSGNQG